MDRHPSGRERLHNPNYPPPMHHYAPSIPQPPAQPAADPFPRSRRDPFLSSAASEKREHHYSNSVFSSNGASRIETLQPAPAPPQSPFHGFGPTHGEHSRRSSISGGYTPTSRDPPPPPPPPTGVHNRQMPPPAPSPKETLSTAYQRGSLPNPSNFSTRDTLGHRPGSSMSISSIMGSDQGIAPRGPPMRAPFGSRTPQHPNGPFTQPNSPAYERRPGFFGELNGEGRPRTPERRPEPHFPPPFARPRQGMSPTSSGLQGPLHEHGAQGASKFVHPQTSPTDSSLPPRPYSQPTGPGFLAQEQRYRPPAHDPLPPPQSSASGMLGSRPRELTTNGQLRDQFDRLERTQRDRAMSDADARKNGSLLFQPFAKPVSEQVHNGNPGPPPPDGPFMQRPEYQPRVSKADGPRPHEYAKPFETTRYPRSPPLSHNDRMPGHHGFGPVYTSAFMPGAPAGVGRPPDRPEYGSFASTSSNADGMHNGGMGGRRTPIVDGQLRGSIEDSNAHHRSFLSGLDQDRLRRQDRGSPLPQAVHGAQSQPAGLHRDPGIKSEFGRMFSGLGSGVGSTPVPSASFAPPSSIPRSPLADHMEVDKVRRATPDVRRPSATLGRGGRKGNKRVHDDDIRMGSESGDGRATPVGSGRGGKRSKYALPSHHHHHHPPTLHHHHHHRKAEEESAPQPSSQSAGSSPFASFKFPATASNAPPNPVPSPIPHHHHHHHPPHHHHHPPKTSPTTPQAPPPRLPTTTILTKPLLQSISHLPREHLGSQLYKATVHLPAITSTTVDSRRTYTTSPTPLPDFSGKENCTFTIRVPRYYLADEARQTICADRQLWGTDIYTDDSDPIAAAIHAGWIRGAWGPDVDIELLSLNGGQATAGRTVDSVEDKTSDKKSATTPKKDSNSTTKLLAPPKSGPVVPPANTDMHVTLLILPALERYASSVWHGIKSRNWGGNHDGMSFKIERVEFVDEGFESRYEERGSDSKKRRIKDSAATSSGGLSKDLTKAVLTSSILMSGSGLLTAGNGRKPAASATLGSYRRTALARPPAARVAQAVA